MIFILMIALVAAPLTGLVVHEIDKSDCTARECKDKPEQKSP